jgi:hypothetical protein
MNPLKPKFLRYLYSQLLSKPYLVLRQAIPLVLVEELLGEMIRSPDEWEHYQEVPVEVTRSDSRLRCISRKIANSVQGVIERMLNVRCLVPSNWSETTYLRRKKRHEFTRLHQDFDFFQKRGYVSFQNEPAYTWWVQLSKPCPNSSHLEFFESQTSPPLAPKLMQGDLLIFHQSVWHRGTTHSAKMPRFSVDGRFLLREVLTGDIANDRLTQSSLKAPVD